MRGGRLLRRVLRSLAALYRCVVFPGGREVDAARFLCCWFAVYLLAFSVAATKMPPVASTATAFGLENWPAAVPFVPH